MDKVKTEKFLTDRKLANPVVRKRHSSYYSIDAELKKDYADKSESIESVDSVLDETRIETKLLVMNVMNKYFDWNSTRKDTVRRTVSKITDELLSNRDIFANLSELKNLDDYTFEHSINVCVISLVIGINLNYSMDKLREVGAGAMLHDIGKLRISREILKKPSGLTDEEFNEIKKHTIYGYQILKDNRNISEIAAYIALSHHERHDGNGYPMQLKGNEINEFARIVAVADVFDALSSDRVYRKKLSPQEIIEYITETGSHHFDPEVVDKFINLVTMYSIGTKVILNTGERGVVVANNRGLPLNPVVRVIYDENKNRLEDYYEINLADSLNIFIEDVCDIEWKT